MGNDYFVSSLAFPEGRDTQYCNEKCIQDKVLFLSSTVHMYIFYMPYEIILIQNYIFIYLDLVILYSYSLSVIYDTIYYAPFASLTGDDHAISEDVADFYEQSV